MNIIIELTRDCNLRCDHCLRGEPQKMHIQKKLVETLFQAVPEIYNLTLSGGEPALVPEKINMVTNLIKKHKVDVLSFYIATNGTIASNKFLCSVLNLWGTCTDNEASQLHISNDSFHNKDLIEKNLNRFQALSFSSFKHYPKSF